MSSDNYALATPEQLSPASYLPPLSPGHWSQILKSLAPLAKSDKNVYLAAFDSVVARTPLRPLVASSLEEGEPKEIAYEQVSNFFLHNSPSYRGVEQPYLKEIAAVICKNLIRRDLAPSYVELYLRERDSSPLLHNICRIPGCARLAVNLLEAASKSHTLEYIRGFSDSTVRDFRDGSCFVRSVPDAPLRELFFGGVVTTNFKREEADLFVRGRLALVETVFWHGTPEDYLAVASRYPCSWVDPRLCSPELRDYVMLQVRREAPYLIKKLSDNVVGPDWEPAAYVPPWEEAAHRYLLFHDYSELGGLFEEVNSHLNSERRTTVGSREAFAKFVRRRGFCGSGLRHGLHLCTLAAALQLHRVVTGKGQLGDLLDAILNVAQIWFENGCGDPLDLHLAIGGLIGGDDELTKGLAEQLKSRDLPAPSPFGLDSKNPPEVYAVLVSYLEQLDPSSTYYRGFQKPVTDARTSLVSDFYKKLSLYVASVYPTFLEAGEPAKEYVEKDLKTLHDCTLEVTEGKPRLPAMRVNFETSLRTFYEKACSVSSV